MANKDANKDELDLDVQQKPGGKKQLILYIVIGVLVLALGGLGAAFFLMKGGEGKDKGAGADSKAAEVKQAHYLALDKLVVNFGPGAPVRFLQVNLQVMSYDPEALKAMETHMPAIRNDILLLLGSQKYEVVSTPEGKEQLRGAILAKVQNVLDTYEKERKVEAVYYTEFVMQ
ncbi:flagellar basal body-associated FliL family protein [Sulfurivermis fontis]|uniref:flagellar basal body-associated FliL family protein n=1 Tax=Sulfurivermis fontis TaxID=1972068 RepID=UPI000FD71906|nr:flagellar basal body-associated FliL family protein [Sulfurivermis fontis]